MPLSRASCINRLMGADSGLTIPTIRLAAMMFPNPMLTSFISNLDPPCCHGRGLAQLSQELADLTFAQTLNTPVLIDANLVHDPL